MARVIEIYIPKSFRKPLRTAAQTQFGKIIEFARARRNQLSCKPCFAD
jgi:hypothetical protein